MTDNQKLADFIHQVFNPQGIIVSLGGRYVREQYEYAQAVGNALINPDQSLSLLEAETGVGKSLGYIIPCMIFLSLYPETKQIIISTFTRILQKQVIQKDIPLARRALEVLGLPEVVSGYRMGRQAFFCLERTKLTVNRLKEKNQLNDVYIEELDAFLAFVIESCNTGSGLWLDWIDEYFAFPHGISSRDICLLYDGQINNEAYIKHINASLSARILITNHATLIGHDTVTDFSESAYAVVVDEAHHVDRLMAERSNKNLSVKRIQYILNSAHDFGINAEYVKSTKSFVKNWAAAIKQFDLSHGSHEIFYIASNGYAQFLKDQVEFVTHIESKLRQLEKDFRIYQKQQKLNNKQMEALEYLDEALITLSHWRSSNDYLYNAVVFGDLERTPTLAVVNPIASRLFAKTVKRLTSRIIITSATLFDGREGEGRVHSFAGDIGFASHEITQYLELTPWHYGDMQFVLASTDIPVPTSYDKDNLCNRFNHYWLKYTAKMIEVAAKSGPTLVLTYSFEESRLIEDELIEIGVGAIVQSKGKRLMECLPDFLNGANNILVTPSGWDGLNLRTLDDEQLVQNVVITRIPNQPKNILEEYVAREYMLGRNMPPHIVDNLLWMKHKNHSIRTLKQGLGRGVRSPSDKVTLWIADPRMPRANSPKAKPLINAIPERFMGNYAKARICEINGELATPFEHQEIDIVL